MAIATQKTCGKCEGRARSEDERRMACEYCGGSGVCEDGHKLLAARETPPADPADLARVGNQPADEELQS